MLPRHTLLLLAITTSLLTSLRAGAEDWRVSGTFTMDTDNCGGASSLSALLGRNNGFEILLPDPTTRQGDFLCKELFIGSEGWAFEFTGPDAELLNSEVGDLFVQGGHGLTEFLYLGDEQCWTGADFYIWPADTDTGVYFEVTCAYSSTLDGWGYPILEEFDVGSCHATLFDNRGTLCSVRSSGAALDTLSAEIVPTGDDDDDATADDDDDTTASDDDEDSAADDDDVTADDDDDEGPFEGDDAGECADGADNDRDGLFDCDDPDCEGAPDCTDGCRCSHQATGAGAGAGVMTLLGLGLLATLRWRRS